jgi:hypothetical protein
MRLLWTAEVAPALQGLAPAREGGRMLAWDSRHGLFLLDARGHRVAQCPAPAELVAACCSGDGASFATISASGRVCLLGPELLSRWEGTIPQGQAVALDSFGDRLAAADGSGGLHLFDRDGKTVWRTAAPRPLRFLTFAPEAAALVGSADFGFVVCCDANGGCLWRDAPVTHTGSLTANGDGSVVALARYGDGLCCYSVRRSQPRVLRAAAPCRLADVSYDGRTFLTAGLDDRVCLRDLDGISRAEWALPARLVALALSPGGDRAVVALANGTVHVLASKTS